MQGDNQPMDIIPRGLAIQDQAKEFEGLYSTSIQKQLKHYQVSNPSSHFWDQVDY